MEKSCRNPRILFSKPDDHCEVPIDDWTTSPGTSQLSFRTPVLVAIFWQGLTEISSRTATTMHGGVSYDNKILS